MSPTPWMASPCEPCARAVVLLGQLVQLLRPINSCATPPGAEPQPPYQVPCLRLCCFRSSSSSSASPTSF